MFHREEMGLEEPSLQPMAREIFLEFLQELGETSTGKEQPLTSCNNEGHGAVFGWGWDQGPGHTQVSG